MEPNVIKQVRKRGGDIVDFSQDKITQAIYKALKAVGRDDEALSLELSDKVVRLLNNKFHYRSIPAIEEIQDMVEEVLIKEDLVKAAKAYIIYREQHSRLRDLKKLIDSDDVINGYLKQLDWRVKENANMAYSLQGLNNHVASAVSSHYWLNRVYPPEIREAHMGGALHLHDLQLLAVYCCGWDLQALLRLGFGGVEGKIHSKPAKHLRVALSQMVNFFYTLQGEAAGAEAFANFDTLLAPFVRYDGLNEKEVRQAMQEFIFGMNVPTRVGFQCLSEDTEILTANGWRDYKRIKEGDDIATFNVESGVLEYLPVKRLFARKYQGKMYNLKNRISDQLISPEHRVVRRQFNGGGYILEPIEKVLKLKSLFIVPVAEEVDGQIKISDTQINEVKVIGYEGVIWCPNTDNETVVARRNGKIFITGNTPFTNLTFDLTCPSIMANEAVIIGGLPQKETYKEFQSEMDMINRAFAEVMMAGDANGRVFTFPIPTYNISTDFNWDNKILDPIWEMTAKYGIPYFANFVNSDMKPEDARSMCISPKEEVLVRNSANIKRLSFGQMVDKYRKTEFDLAGWADCDLSKNLELLSLNPETGKMEWARAKRFLKVEDNRQIRIMAEDGKSFEVSSKHIIPVLTETGMVNKFAKDIKNGDYLLNLKRADEILNTSYQWISDFILNEDLAKILGFFTADGNYLFENRKNLKSFGRPRGLQFTFNARTKKDLAEVKELIEKIFKTAVKEKKDPRYNSYYLYVYNTELARKLFDAGFKKYGHLPDIIFNSPITVIEGFLDYHFRGDGYEKRKEIHINDKELASDLVILYSLIGRPVTYRERKNSQVVRIQHQKAKINQKGILSNPLISERVPGFLAKSTYLVPGLNKSRMVGFDALDKYQAQTKFSLSIKNSDYYIVRVKKVIQKIFTKARAFFDVELETNHLFVHSLGVITHNCCRLRLDNRELRKRGGGLFAANPLTGSIGVVTINMSRLGYLSKTRDEYFNRLGQTMDLAKQSLQLKREILESFTEQGLYPYSKYYLKDIKERFGEYWRNHFNTIGLNGMNESLINFMKRPLSTKEGQEFALEVMDFMLQRLGKYQEGDNQLYNLEASPAEGATYRFAKKDKELYPDIIVANEEAYQESGAAPYYTNSTHLPVNFSTDIFEVLEKQDGLQTKYTGGTVVHGFLGERMPDAESTKNLVRKIAENFHLPYYTLTPTFSICPKHGYLAGEHRFCPICDEEIGYIREQEEKLPL